MKKYLPLLLVLLFSKETSFAQTCNVIDSLSVNPVGTIDTLSPLALFYVGDGFWTSGPTYSDNYIYKVGFNGNRIDSISYFDVQGYSVEAIAVDSQYLWAYRFSVDTLFQFSLSTKQLVNAISMGGRSGINEEFMSIAQNGDTLYFIGADIGTTFKFVKSTSQFIDFPVFTDWLPTGLFYLNDTLIATAYTPILGPKVFKITSANFTDDTSSHADWCLPSYSHQLAYDGHFFWQTEFKHRYIYKIASDIATGVNETSISNAVNLYPNPVSDKLVIECGTLAYEHPSISFYDMLGNRLNIRWGLQGDKLEANTSTLPSGVYLARVNVNGEYACKKFVKE